MLQSRAPAHRQLTDGAGARRAHTCPRPPHVGHGLPLRRRNRVLTFRGSWSVLTTATMISSSVLPMGKYHPVFVCALICAAPAPEQFFLQCSSSAAHGSRVGAEPGQGRQGQKDVNSTLGRPGCLRATNRQRTGSRKGRRSSMHRVVIPSNYATGARAVPGP